MRDVLAGVTLQLDQVQGGSGSGGVAPVFQDAAGDGSRVWFTDTQQLTADSGASTSRPDLYECVVVVEGAGVRCVLSDLTPETGLGEQAEVQGSIVGVSREGCDIGSVREGCFVYFIANSVLAAGAVHGDCAQAASPPGAVCDLYVVHDGVTRLVAVLSGEDDPDWANGSRGGLDKLVAGVSPDGRWLAFMSDRGLTGYDTADAVSGRLDEEVYLYEAETGRLVCASCDPSGGRPEGVEAGGDESNKIRLVGGDRVWEPSAWLAGNVPGWTPFELGKAGYESRFVSDTGRLFFNARGGLVPRDVNGEWDVYEWEPEGVGPAGAACGRGVSGGGVVFKPGGVARVEGRVVVESAGCVGLMSSGSSSDESAFLDASESGGDVFFLTTAKLSPQDLDDAYDVYDAHECTTGSPCVMPAAEQPPACVTAEACRAAPSVQPSLFGAPSSATFTGAGNLAPAPAAKIVVLTRAQKLAAALKRCRRDRQRKKRAACETTAKHRYGVRKPKTARKSSKQGSVARGAGSGSGRGSGGRGKHGGR